MCCWNMWTYKSQELGSVWKMHPVVSLRVCKDIFKKSKRWNLLLLLSFFDQWSLVQYFSSLVMRMRVRLSRAGPLRKHCMFVRRCVNADSPHLLYTSSRGVVLHEVAACDLVRVQESKKTEPSDKWYFCPMFWVFGRWLCRTTAPPWKQPSG